MINPKADLFRWGPIPGRPIYVSYFMESIATSFPQKYPWKWPEIFFYFIKEKMTFICEYAPLRQVGKTIFLTLLEEQKLHQAEKKYQAALHRLQAIQSKVKGLQKLNDTQLLSLYQRWQAAYLAFWDHGLIPELANWGGEQELKEQLEKLHLPPVSFIKALERLSAPEKLSFYQEEELSLLRLKQKEGSRDFSKALQNHTQSNFWISNSYHKTTVLREEYFLQKLRELEGKDIRQEIEKIASFPHQIKKGKKKMVEELNIPKDVQQIAKLLSHCIWWQDARKKQIFIANHFISKFLREASRRWKILPSALEVYWVKEMEQAMSGMFLPQTEVERRKKRFLGYYDTQDFRLISEAKEWQKLTRPFLETKIEQDIQQIRGTVASLGKGKVQGRVKILHSSKEAEKMELGDILVAPMTSPEFIIAMRKATAIVTDEGGMTSHAAIVSRELGVPCIVGTKVATKVLKDGDMVEVDAEKGMVRKISA